MAEKSPGSRFNFGTSSPREEPIALKVAADSKKLLQDIHDKPTRLLTKYEKAVEHKIERNRSHLGPRPSSTSPRARQLRNTLSIEAAELVQNDKSNFVRAFELKEEVLSLQRVLLGFLFLRNISENWRELILFRNAMYSEKEVATANSSQNFTSSNSFMIQAVLTIQKWYRRLKDLKIRHTSATIIASSLQALKQSHWCKLRAYIYTIKRCQRMVRGFIVCTAARLHALNEKWQNFQNSAISKKAKQFIPKTTRYYLLLEWLRKIRKQSVVSSLRYEQAIRTGVTSFTEVDEEQVRRFLQPVGPRITGNRRISMQIPQLVVSVDASCHCPSFVVYSRDMFEEDFRNMVQRALRLTPKDLPVKDLHILALFLPEMRKSRQAIESEVVRIEPPSTSSRRKRASDLKANNDSLGGNRTEVARLMRAVNKMVLSHRHRSSS